SNVTDELNGCESGHRQYFLIKPYAGHIHLRGQYFYRETLTLQMCFYNLRHLQHEALILINDLRFGHFYINLPFVVLLHYFLLVDKSLYFRSTNIEVKRLTDKVCGTML